MAATTRLLVTEAFPGHVPGDRITDAAEMKRIQQTYPDHVLREAVQAEDAPAKATQDAALPPPKPAPAAPVTTHNINDAPGA